MALSAIAMMQLRERQEKRPAPECTCPMCGQEIQSLAACVVDEEGHTASVFGRAIDMSPTDARILRALVDCYPNLARKGHLMDRLYGIDADRTNEKIISIYIMRLRRKLAGTGLKIHTHWGVGFRLAVDSEAAA